MGLEGRTWEQQLAAGWVERKDPGKEFLKMIRPMPLKISDEIRYFFY